ncbi:MAG: hypothetical protein CMJ83_10685, partial [Planctomycetes bacterium]|nr:hypothetical protein [Planctomycetota bacterium]
IALAPEHPHANHCYGILLKHLSRFDEAEACFRKVLARDPHDPTANYYLGTLMIPAKRPAEAEKLFKKAIAVEPHQQSAIFQLFNLYFRQDKEAQAETLVTIFEKLEQAESGNKAGIVYSEMGRYGNGIRPFPVPVPPGADVSGGVSYTMTVIGNEAPGRDGRVRKATETFAAGTPRREALLRRLPGIGLGASLADVDGDGDQDLWTADGKGPGRLWMNDGGTFSDVSSEWGIHGAGPSVSGCFGDYDHDGRPDLYVCCAGLNRLFRNDGKKFVDVTKATGVGGGDVLSVQAVMADLDADGDIDIYVANLADLTGPAATTLTRWPDDYPGTKNHLFNNDRNGKFTDIAARTGTDGGASRSVGIIAADLDGDHDADLLVVNEGQPPFFFRNDRIWRFTDRTAASPDLAARTGGFGAMAADLDRDGLADVVLFARSGTHFYRNAGGDRLESAGTPANATSGCILDADNDGDLDQLLYGNGAASLRLATRDGWEDGGKTQLPAGVRTMLPVDADGDGVLDVVVTRAGNDLPPLLLKGKLDRPHHWIEIGLKGVREEGKMRANTGGVGARVTVVSGTLNRWQEIMTAGSVLGGPSPCLHFGLGVRTQLDYVSVIWPDDLLQGESGISADTKKVITQTYRKSSSCPLLFAWNGERMVFVTDFLGVGGLGFFIEPGTYAPPDPTELVWIPSLEPKDGQWVLSIHEPMEEILYLDEAKLLVVDHPEGFVVVPDERLAVLGPAPDGRLVAYRPDEAIFPIGLETLAGSADAALLRETDRRYQPGVMRDKRFIGFAAPQEIVLDFGAALASARDQDLFLFIDGWVEYPYSHVNFAAWQAGLALQAISIDVESKGGTWHPVFDQFGYPAGMPRVMTLDVSKLPRDGTGRIRLRTNLELYIDRLWLARDHGKDVVTVKTLDPASAELRRSGYPREYSPDGEEPLLYDYALMDNAIDYKTMEGDYTRFGDVRTLLRAPDDQYVILGRAEEILLRFDVIEDPGPGRARSFILKSDGYCKDMDLYTAHPHTVGPLPFHGMSTFPYPPGEHYPRSKEHDAYRRTFNTRRLLR